MRGEHNSPRLPAICIQHLQALGVREVVARPVNEFGLEQIDHVLDFEPEAEGRAEERDEVE